MINFLEKEKIFTLDTQNTTYALGVYPNGALVHLYYGNKIKSTFSIDDADGKTVVVVAVNILAKPNAPFEKICLKGLDKTALYECEGKVYGGDFLENVGIVLKNGKDFSSEIMIFKRIDK